MQGTMLNRLMFQKNAPYFADHGGLVLAQVTGRHEQFRRHSIDVRTFVRHHAVATAALGGSCWTAMIEWALVPGARPS